MIPNEAASFSSTGLVRAFRRDGVALKDALSGNGAINISLMMGRLTVLMKSLLLLRLIDVVSGPRIKQLPWEPLG